MHDGYDVIHRESELCVRAWGKDEQELFSRALLGLAAALHPHVASGAVKASLRLHIRAGSLSDLLSKFLSWVLFESEMRDTLFPAMHVVLLTPEEIECELIGKSVEYFEEEAGDVTLQKLERLGVNRWESEFSINHE